MTTEGKLEFLCRQEFGMITLLMNFEFFIRMKTKNMVLTPSAWSVLPSGSAG